MNKLLYFILSLSVAMSASEQIVANVMVQKATISTLTHSVEGYGSIMFNPVSTTALSFESQAKIDVVTVVPGQKVHKGETLAKLSLTESDKSTLTMANISIDYARKDKNRVLAMKEVSLATNADVDVASQNLEKAQRSKVELSKRFHTVMGGTLNAPFEGVVQAVAINNGDIVQSSTPLIFLSKLNLLSVSLGIEPTAAYKVHSGQKISIIPLSSQAQPFIAIVTSVSASLDPKTRLITVWARVPSEVKTYAGTPVRGKIMTETRGGIIVPSSAVMTHKGRTYCFVMKGNKVFEQNIKVIPSVDGRTLVTNGLKKGEMIVVTGNYECENGMRVIQKAVK